MIPVPIKAIIFDMGGTLRVTVPRDAKERSLRVTRLQELIGSTIPPDKFLQQVSAKFRSYRRWSDTTLIELDEASLWSDWLLPDLPREKIAPLAVELNRRWRECRIVQNVFPETVEVIPTLFRRGYRLGLASNTTSSTEVPETLDCLGLSRYFETVILSCNNGRRKPDPGMLASASQALGIPPERCVYIGDQPARDVVAARRASYASAILLADPRNRSFRSQLPPAQPDRTITNLKDLLEIFPQMDATR